MILVEAVEVFSTTADRMQGEALNAVSNERFFYVLQSKLVKNGGHFLDIHIASDNRLPVALLSN